MNKNQLNIKRLDIQQGDFITTNTGNTLRVDRITALGFIEAHDVSEVEYTIEGIEVVTNEEQ